MPSSSIDPLPIPRRAPAEPVRGNTRHASHDGAPSADDKNAPAFDDLLEVEDGQERPTIPSSPGGPKKSKAGTSSPDFSTHSSVASVFDPTTSPDWIAMAAAVAGPPAVEPVMIATPSFEGGAVTAVSVGLEGGSDLTAIETTGRESAAMVGTNLLSAASELVQLANGAPSKGIHPESSLPSLAPTPAPAATMENEADVRSTVPVTLPATPRETARAAMAGAQQTSSLSATEENIAARPVPTSALEKNRSKDYFRNFLKTDSEEVKESPSNLGTDVARPTITMAAVPFSHRQSPPVEAVGAATANGNPSVAAPDFAKQLGETASVAHRAVDAVLSAAERVSGERNSVNLQFSVGGSELAVRVEYRGGEVHATFRTDSSELRAALEHQWSAAGSKLTDASIRMAPPVFTSSNLGSSTDSSQHGASQQQRDNATRSFSDLFSFNPTRSGRGDANPETPAPTAPRPTISTALHLHTFA